MRVAGKVALVSGGARGLGEAQAKLLAAEGAKVAIGDVLEEEGKKVEAAINELGGEAFFMPLDVTQADQWQQIIDETVSRFGKLDVLVNNAGIGGRGGLEDMTEDEWDEVMAVNAKGVFLGTKLAMPEILKAGGGSIVNISSQMGIVGSDTSNPAYQASKAAVHVFHQVHSSALRHTGSPRQLGSPRPHRHANASGRLHRPRTHAKSDEQGAHGQSGPTGGDSLRRALPLIRRVVFHHWRGPSHRRRIHSPLKKRAPLMVSLSNHMTGAKHTRHSRTPFRHSRA